MSLGRDHKTGGNPSFQLYVLKMLNKINTSVLAALSKEKTVKQTLINGNNLITFNTPYPDANWYFEGTPLCYDSLSTVVVPLITLKTANGFTVNIGDAGTIECTVNY